MDANGPSEALHWQRTILDHPSNLAEADLARLRSLLRCQQANTVTGLGRKTIGLFGSLVGPLSIAWQSRRWSTSHCCPRCALSDHGRLDAQAGGQVPLIFPRKS